VELPLFDVIDTVRELGWPGAFELFRNGLTLGSLYALIALGYSMVYGILKLLNFAHGDVYMIGAFIGYGVLTSFNGPLTPTIALAPLIALMFLAAMLGAGLLGVVIERFAYRPLRDAPRIAPLISALGVSFFLQNSALLLFGSQFRTYNPFLLGGDPELFLPGPLIDPVFTVAGIPVQTIQVVVVAMTVGLMVTLTLLVARTRIGKAMRATAYDREAAAMMGIDTDRVIASTFFIGSVLAGAAGVMFGLLYSQIFHFMGFLAGLKGFTAAVVGGIGSIPGAMLGGFLVGLVEAYATGYVGGRWSDLIVFAILIFVLLVRPSGLLGTRAIQKV
jgi:branched-chain amino acid transport system permease protein